MPVQFIGGKPGGGKTLLAMRIIIDELRRPTRRTIVTNIAIRFGELAAYCQEHGIDYGTPLIEGRFVILEEEQLAEFYRYRQRGVVLPMRGPDQADYSQVRDGGVLVVLDEVHIPFNARAWQATGRGVIYYLSQHRKLGDDVVLISQSIQNVDKQMRSMAQDFTYVRNLTKEKHSWFRLPAIFVRKVYLELPTGPSVKAVETGTFKLDVTGVARCYDTAAGVGIVGRAGADTLAKRRGLHWAWFVLGVAVIMFAGLKYIPDALARELGGGVRPVAAAVDQAAKAGRPNAVQVASPAEGGRAEKRISAVGQASTNRVTGIAFIGGRYHVCLSDGRILIGETLRCPAPGWVWINGTLCEAASGL